MLVACKGDDPVPPGPCFGCADPAFAGAGVIVQNKTDHTVSFTIREVRDKNEYIANMGRPDVARIRMLADIAAAEAARDTAIKRAEAEREAAIRRAQADQ